MAEVLLVPNAVISWKNDPPPIVKSMGGRIASRVADEAGVAGLVCLGYPFHPVGKPEQLRVEHLQTITTPTLILPGRTRSVRKPRGGG